jgi:hypothetical protein
MHIDSVFEFLAHIRDLTDARTHHGGAHPRSSAINLLRRRRRGIPELYCGRATSLIYRATEATLVIQISYIH